MLARPRKRHSSAAAAAAAAAGGGGGVRARPYGPLIALTAVIKAKAVTSHAAASCCCVLLLLQQPDPDADPRDLRYDYCYDRYYGT